METTKTIERLLQFSMQHNLICEEDIYVARNTLLDLFGALAPYDGPVPQEQLDSPAALLEQLCDDGAAKGLFDNEVYQLRVNFEARIMGAVMPRESEITAKFQSLYETKGAQAATDYFYDLCLACYYIRTAQIAKNINWVTKTAYGDMEITVNRTKPEKDPKAIAAARNAKSAGYPKCMLCIENIGYAGRADFPGRQNHRVVPVTLNGEPWYFQYSPYVYYNEHCIVFAKEHKPMHIGAETLEQLFDFVRQFPHYLVGSNADLPIVGGSILSHTHFQGGHYEFPMNRAKDRAHFTSKAYPQLRISALEWPVSAVRVTGTDVAAMQAFGTQLMDAWRNYTDESAEILAFTQEDGKQVPHNTVTPILHKNGAGEYVLDLVPRNNRTSAEHPDGIFHPHKEIHNIKKENIGLIEVMGLAVLPGRLATEGARVENVLCGKETQAAVAAELPLHAAWLEELCTRYGTQNEPTAVHAIVEKEIGEKFTMALVHAGVFKLTPEGDVAMARFMATLGCDKAN